MSQALGPAGEGMRNPNRPEAAWTLPSWFLAAGGPPTPHDREPVSPATPTPPREEGAWAGMSPAPAAPYPRGGARPQQWEPV